MTLLSRLVPAAADTSTGTGRHRADPPDKHPLFTGATAVRAAAWYRAAARHHARQTAAQLDAIAVWLDTELAAGQPPKWVARQAAAAMAEIARNVRETHR